MQGPGYDFYRNKQLFDPKDKLAIELGLQRVFGYGQGGVKKINQAIAAQVCTAILVQIDGMFACIFSCNKFNFCFTWGRSACLSGGQLALAAPSHECHEMAKNGRVGYSQRLQMPGSKEQIA